LPEDWNKADHHASCRPSDSSLVWQCGQCGHVAAADDIDARLRNQAAQITGRHQYVGQDYEFRIERLTERAEAAESRAAALQKELEAAHRAMEWSITDIAIHMPDGPAKDEALARIKAITRKRADAALSKESPDE
jgi:hypothetical protein